MTEVPDPHLSIDSIVPPDVPPPDVPDEQATREENAYTHAKATPTERICAAHEACERDLRDQVRRLREENDRHREELRHLHAELDSLRPKHAALWQASRTNSLIDVAALVGMGTGGAAISAASLLPLQAYTGFVSGTGVALLLPACLIMIYTKLLCWPKG